jgi:hypothetical protein
MRDYTPLRALAAQKESVHLKSSTVNELLDELEALRAAAAPTKMKRNDYPAPFEEVWQAYPTRPGANKRATFKAWSARIKAGVTAETMLAGARAYAAYIQATGQHLKLPETFFGPDEHFASDWTPPEVAKKPTGVAWWLSDTTRLAKAVEVGVGPAHSGESTASWEARIRAAIDNGGKPPAPVQMIRPQAQPMPIAEIMPAVAPARRSGKPEGLIQMMKEIGRIAPPGKAA